MRILEYGEILVSIIEILQEVLIVTDSSVAELSMPVAQLFSRLGDDLIVTQPDNLRGSAMFTENTPKSELINN